MPVKHQKTKIPPKPKVSRFDRELLAALTEGSRDALRQAQAAGVRVPLWRDGQIVWVSASTVLRTLPKPSMPRRKAKAAA
jgi:hypothetical protein